MSGIEITQHYEVNKSAVMIDSSENICLIYATKDH